MSIEEIASYFSKMIQRNVVGKYMLVKLKRKITKVHAENEYVRIKFL